MRQFLISLDNGVSCLVRSEGLLDELCISFEGSEECVWAHRRGGNRNGHWFLLPDDRVAIDRFACLGGIQDVLEGGCLGVAIRAETPMLLRENLLVVPIPGVSKSVKISCRGLGAAITEHDSFVVVGNPWSGEDPIRLDILECRWHETGFFRVIESRTPQGNLLTTDSEWFSSFVTVESPFPDLVRVYDTDGTLVFEGPWDGSGDPVDVPILDNLVQPDASAGWVHATINDWLVSLIESASGNEAVGFAQRHGVVMAVTIAYVGGKVYLYTTGGLAESDFLDLDGTGSPFRSGSLFQIFDHPAVKEPVDFDPLTWELPARVELPCIWTRVYVNSHTPYLIAYDEFYIDDEIVAEGINREGPRLADVIPVNRPIGVILEICQNEHFVRLMPRVSTVEPLELIRHLGRVLPA